MIKLGAIFFVVVCVVLVAIVYVLWHDHEVEVSNDRIQRRSEQIHQNTVNECSQSDGTGIFPRGLTREECEQAWHDAQEVRKRILREKD